MENSEKSVKDVHVKMARLCSRSEQCSADIRKKILSAGLDHDVAEEIIVELIEEKFLDDKRYARAFAKDKFKINKWGRIKIRYYMKQKGLYDDAIGYGLAEIDEEQYKKALLKTMKEKARKVKKKSKYEKMGQIIRFAQSRGYEPELIHRYMNEVLE